MKLSANKAHKLAKISKKTLQDALESGTLSGTKNDKGHWEIDLSELQRVYPEARAEQGAGTTSKQPQITPENSVLQVELNAERDMRTRLEAEIDDLKGQRDEWMNQAKTLALPKPSNQNQTGQGRDTRGLWARITNK